MISGTTQLTATKPFARRLAAGLAAAALSMTAGGALAPVAVSAPTVRILVPGSPFITRDTGSITIHKFVGPEGDTPAADGTQQDISGKTPLPGVEYTITQLDADMSTNAGQLAARKLTVQSPAKSGGVTKKMTTGPDGNAAFEKLPIGVYKVEETKVPDGVVPASPFLVFVPMTDPGRKKWNYQVHVYPKNAKVTVTKKVTDRKSKTAPATVGSTVTYDIDTDVPARHSKDGKKQPIAKYVVGDTLPAGVSVKKVTARVGSTNLTVSPSAGSGDASWAVSGSAFTLTFTKAGLEKLGTAVDANPAVKLTTTLEATIDEAKKDNGQWRYTNTATLTVNNGGSDTVVTSNPVETRLGAVTITKTDKDKKPISAPATFQITTCEATGKGIHTTSGALSVAGKRSWQTTAQGTLTITGLQVSDFANNKAVGSDDQTTYCLVETQAPDGYELLSKPVPFHITSPTEEGAAMPVADVPVVDVKKTSVELPLTGGKGIWLLVGVGAAIMLAGFLYARRNTRA